MHVVVRRQVLDVQPRALDRPREDEVRRQVPLARALDRGEAHADLERDARLRRVDGHRPVLPCRGHVELEQLTQPGSPRRTRPAPPPGRSAACSASRSSARRPGTSIGGACRSRLWRRARSRGALRRSGYFVYGRAERLRAPSGAGLPFAYVRGSASCHVVPLDLHLDDALLQLRVQAVEADEVRPADVAPGTAGSRRRPPGSAARPRCRSCGSGRRSSTPGCVFWRPDLRG